MTVSHDPLIERCVLALRRSHDELEHLIRVLGGGFTPALPPWEAPDQEAAALRLLEKARWQLYDLVVAVDQYEIDERTKNVRA